MSGWLVGLKKMVLLAAITTAACSQVIASPFDEHLTRGQAIYQKSCATETYHGVDVEGIPGKNGFRDWHLVGEGFQRRNPTAQVVFDVVRSGGEPDLRALSDFDIQHRLKRS